MRMLIPWESLGIDVAGEAASAEEGIRLAEEIRPDLMLVDITMPGMDGIEMIRQIKEELPCCHFIILSCHREVQYLTSAIRTGVADYIIKDSLDPEEITCTLRKLVESYRAEGSLKEEATQIKKVEEIFMEAVQDDRLSCGEFLKKINDSLFVRGTCFVFVLETKNSAVFRLRRKYVSR